jgi:hypothetical protein
LRLYEARALLYASKYAKAVQIAGDIQKSMMDFDATNDSPQFLFISNRLNYISIGLQEYRPCEADFDKNGEELHKALKVDASSGTLETAAASRAALEIQIAAISKRHTYARKYRDASKLIQPSISTIKPIKYPFLNDRI